MREHLNLVLVVIVCLLCITSPAFAHGGGGGHGWPGDRIRLRTEGNDKETLRKPRRRVLLRNKALATNQGLFF